VQDAGEFFHDSDAGGILRLAADGVGMHRGVTKIGSSRKDPVMPSHYTGKQPRGIEIGDKAGT